MYADDSNALALGQYDYPPRVKFDIEQLEGAETSTLDLTVLGMSEKVSFPVPLKVSSETQGELQWSVMCEQYHQFPLAEILSKV